MSFDRPVAQIAQALLAARLRLVAAESCTGGWVAKVLTDRPGSSEWFERGFVTYSEAAKCELLGVSAATLERFGAVSEQTAREMAEGALNHSHADISVAVTGVAGPTGGSEETPVGTVWFAWGRRGGATHSRQCRFDGDRTGVRRQAVVAALEGILHVLDQGG